MNKIKLFDVKPTDHEIITDIVSKIGRGVLVVHGDVNDNSHHAKGVLIEKDSVYLQFDTEPYNSAVFAVKSSTAFKYNFWI